MLKISRGYRNNNAGNIRKTKDVNGNPTLIYEGEVPSTDKDFKQFKSMIYGYRAMFALIHYYISKGINTIHDIINTYAPSSENATDKYVATVASMTGKDPNWRIDQSDDIFMQQLIASISYVENGIDANMNDVNSGYNLFYNT